MKRNYLYLILIASTISAISFSCSKDETSPTGSNSNFTAKGIDYVPLSSSYIINTKVSALTTEYDSLSKVINSSQITNQTNTISVGASTIVGGLNANPIYTHDKNNYKDRAGYLTNNNGGVSAFINSSEIYTVLPADLVVGKEWSVNVNSSPTVQTKIKLVEALTNYTNSAGMAYQNVINLFVSIKDSIPKSNSKWYKKTIIDGNIYFAKGKGVVGAKLNNYEQISRFKYFSKIKASGVVGTIE